MMILLIFRCHVDLISEEHGAIEAIEIDLFTVRSPLSGLTLFLLN